MYNCVKNLIKLLILGPTGSMGRLISKLALEDDEIKIVAACDINHIGDDLSTLVGSSDPNKLVIRDVAELQSIIDEVKPEIAVDFTIAHAAEKNCITCVNNGIKCVIGTTALSQDFLTEFNKLVNEKQAPAVISSNMATGVNIFLKIAGILAQYLSDWDIEIIEAHHHRKADAPSGTAMMIGQTIADTIGKKFDEIAKFGRNKGPNKREIGAKKEIGVHAIRAGDIVGDHVVLYAGPGERIELKHQTHSRDCLARGSITAIKFIAKAGENKIYTTQEVLNL